MQSSPPHPSSGGAWVPGERAAPDTLLTITAYSKIGEFCGAQPDLERVAAHVVSTWLAATVADHKANVTVANLRESLKECEIPASRHDSWITTISKYLGDPGVPAVLQAPTLPGSAPPSLRTNVKKHQQLRPSIGKEIGVGGLARLRTGFEKGIFSVAPTGQRLKQPQVTAIRRDLRRWVAVTFDNLYGDEEFYEAAGEGLAISFPNLNSRKGATERDWKSVLKNGWSNDLKDKAPTLEVNAEDIQEGTDLHSLMGSAARGFNLQLGDCRAVKTEAAEAEVDTSADRPSDGKGEGEGGGEGEGMSSGKGGKSAGTIDAFLQSGPDSVNGSGFNLAASMPGAKQRGSFRKNAADAPTAAPAAAAKTAAAKGPAAPTAAPAKGRAAAATKPPTAKGPAVTKAAISKRVSAKQPSSGFFTDQGDDDDLFLDATEMASQYGSSLDWKFTSRNAPQLPQPGPAIAPENAVGRVFILPGEYPPFAKDRANEGADFVGWMGVVKSVLDKVSVLDQNTRFHCEFYDAFEDLSSQVLDTCRMLS